MKLRINGEDRTIELPDQPTVTALIAVLELGCRRVAVEVNERIVPRARHGEHVLADGDAVEIVQFVGGG
jgi:sulfur carrier protein